jgi:hypothetical protein
LLYRIQSGTSSGFKYLRLACSNRCTTGQTAQFMFGRRFAVAIAVLGLIAAEETMGQPVHGGQSTAGRSTE